MEEMKKLSVGDVIKFGSCPQIKDCLDKEPIEWQILEVKDGKAFLLSKYAIFAKEYNNEHKAITWMDCSIREWLNDYFLKFAFNEDEQKQILTTLVVNNDNIDYHEYYEYDEYDIDNDIEHVVDGGVDSLDKIFLLSIDEVKKYFASDKIRRCLPTNYAEVKRIDLDEKLGWHTDEMEAFPEWFIDGKHTCEWWLRSPGIFDSYAAVVQEDGEVYSHGDDVTYTFINVRPAM